MRSVRGMRRRQRKQGRFIGREGRKSNIVPCWIIIRSGNCRVLPPSRRQQPLSGQLSQSGQFASTDAPKCCHLEPVGRPRTERAARDRVAKRSQLFREYGYKTHAFKRFTDQYSAERLVHSESFEDVRNIMDREKHRNGCRREKKFWLIEKNELRLVRGPTGMKGGSLDCGARSLRERVSSLAMTTPRVEGSVTELMIDWSKQSLKLQTENRT